MSTYCKGCEEKEVEIYRLSNAVKGLDEGIQDLLKKRGTDSTSVARLFDGLEVMGPWMSAALDDPKVCDEMKADIHSYLSALERVRATEHQSVERPLEIMEQYLEQIVKPGLETAKTEDDELRSMNFYNGQKQAYEHCIGLIKRTPDTSSVERPKTPLPWAFTGERCPVCAGRMISNSKYEECGERHCKHIKRATDSTSGERNE